MTKRFHTNLAAALSLVSAVALSACSTSMPSIGSINPFGAKSLSPVDRAYLQAAGSWDANHDNVVTCNEWKSYTEDLFNGADTNHDDSLDAGEWPNLVKIDRLFQTADLAYFDGNGDGKVTRAEFVNKPNPAFVLMDKAGSCKLDGSQIASARSKTEYDTSGPNTENSDPRQSTGAAGRAANGAL
jgi:hypothetical protein